jgi:hypothetical protein
MNKITLLLAYSLLIVSCEKDKISGDLIEDPNLYSNLYSDSVDTLTLGDDKYIIEAELYRDFFPGGPIPRKSPLIASIYLVKCDSTSIPDNIEIKKLYVINNQTIWVSDPFDNGQTNYPEYKLFGLSNKGPLWDTDITVDVILKIADNSLQKDYFVIAKDQIIKRIE